MRIEKREGFTIEAEAEVEYSQPAKRYPHLKSALVMWSIALVIALSASCTPPWHQVISSWLLWGTPVFLFGYFIDERRNNNES